MTKDIAAESAHDTPKLLVLAGRRSGALDPLAERAGVSHKCMVPVRGQAMIGRVLATLDRAFPDAQIAISIEDFGLIAKEPTVARLNAAGRLHHIEARFELFDSVMAAAGTLGFPLLITTADNVLVTVEALHALAACGRQEEGGAVVALARKEDIKAAHPGGKDRFYEFRDGGYSNCNLFWLNDEQALAGVSVFRHGGHFLKAKGRMLKTFGLVNVLRYRFRRYGMARMLRFVSRRFGVRIRPLVLKDGGLAIDVDNERSFAMVEEILERRERG